MLFRLGLLVGLVGVFGVSVSAVELTDGDSTRAHQRLESELQLQRDKLFFNDRQRQLKKDPLTFQHLKVQVSEGTTPTTSVTTKFEVDRIILSGVTRLQRFEIRHLIHTYEHTQMGLSDIYALVQSVTRYYVTKGYVTTRAYLPKQSLADGHLEINVVEGRVSDVVYDTPKGDSAVSLSIAFPFLKGRVLNIRDIEQGLSQLNRLGSVGHHVQFYPDGLGKTRVVVTRQVRHGGKVSLRYDNGSSVTSGLYPHQLQFVKSNVFELLDVWQFYFSQVQSHGAQHTTSTSLSVSVPFGYSTFSGSYSYFDYMSLISGDFQTFSSSGLTSSLQGSFQHQLFRSKRYMMGVTLSGEKSRVDSFIEDAKSEVGSRRLTSLSLGIDQSLHTPFGQWSIDVTRHMGLTWFGATQDPEDVAVSDAHSQFRKTSLALRGHMPLSVFGKAFMYQLSAYGQVASHGLYGGQRLSVGGPYSVRGFQLGGIQGEVGTVIRQELSSSLAAWVPITVLKPKLKAIRVFGALDYGEIQSFQPFPGDSGLTSARMLGLAAGTRFSVGDVGVDLTLARPLRATVGVPKDSLEFYFNVGWGIY